MAKLIRSVVRPVTNFLGLTEDPKPAPIPVAPPPPPSAVQVEDPEIKNPTTPRQNILTSPGGLLNAPFTTARFANGRNKRTITGLS